MKSGEENNILQEQKITIMNCNCIDSSEISIKTNALNIKYGLNGTGKSSISKAILYSSNQDTEELAKLKPYNSNEEPYIDNCGFKKVRLFDESYVNRYLFESDSFLNNSYQVFLRDENLDSKKENTENLLKGLRSVFEEVLGCREDPESWQRNPLRAPAPSPGC